LPKSAQAHEPEQATKVGPGRPEPARREVLLERIRVLVDHRSSCAPTPSPRPTRGPDAALELFVLSLGQHGLYTRADTDPTLELRLSVRTAYVWKHPMPRAQEREQLRREILNRVHSPAREHG
jgi:hypothetical protein